MAGRPSLEDEIEAEKAYERVQELALKKEIELDADTIALVKYIIRGHYVGNIGKFMTRDWALNEAIRYWGELREKHSYGSATQRAFEIICELSGLIGTGKTEATELVNVVIGSVNSKEKKAEQD